MADDQDQFKNDPGDDTNPALGLQSDKLAGESTRPFSPPDDVRDRIGQDHPATDTNVDEHEHYDAGIQVASGVELPPEDDDEDE